MIYDDLGDNADALDGNHCLTRVGIRSGSEAIDLRLEHEGRLAFPFETLRLCLPSGERRPVRIGAAEYADGETFEILSAR
jgi:hypothetical protein